MISRAGTIDLIDVGQIIALQPIEYAAVVGHQWLNPRRIEHVQPGDDHPIVALFEHIGIAAAEFREHPGFPELVAGLVVVGAPQHRRECGIGGLATRYRWLSFSANLTRSFAMSRAINVLHAKSA